MPRQDSPPTRGAGAQVSLKRERLELSPVYATAVAHGGHKLGYIRLVNFGAHAAADMEKAMDRLEAQGVEGYILGARARAPLGACRRVRAQACARAQPCTVQRSFGHAATGTCGCVATWACPPWQAARVAAEMGAAMFVCLASMQ